MYGSVIGFQNLNFIILLLEFLFFIKFWGVPPPLNWWWWELPVIGWQISSYLFVFWLGKLNHKGPKSAKLKKMLIFMSY
jgi:hypothetical protein